MIDTIEKAREVEREMYAKLDLTEREKQMLEAIQLLLDKLRGVRD